VNQFALIGSAQAFGTNHGLRLKGSVSGGHLSCVAQSGYCLQHLTGLAVPGVANAAVHLLAIALTAGGGAHLAAIDKSQGRGVDEVRAGKSAGIGDQASEEGDAATFTQVEGLGIAVDEGTKRRWKIVQISLLGSSIEASDADSGGVDSH
jgi:hypothetical protein